MTAGRGWLRRKEQKTSVRLEPKDVESEVLGGCEFRENNGRRGSKKTLREGLKTEMGS